MKWSALSLRWQRTTLLTAAEEHMYDGPDVGRWTCRFLVCWQGDYDTFAESLNWPVLFKRGIDDVSNWFNSCNILCVF